MKKRARVMGSNAPLHQLRALGWSNAKIADALGVQDSTIHTYVTHKDGLCPKLVEIAAQAILEGATAGRSKGTPTYFLIEIDGNPTVRPIRNVSRLTQPGGIEYLLVPVKGPAP